MQENTFRNLTSSKFLESKSNIFYISCIGSSASNWFNKVLSKHPKIVCFQSARSFPPVWPGHTFPYQEYWFNWIKEIPAEKFIQSLMLCNKSTHDEKYFGATHGYHGLLAKEPCEKYGGLFSYIVRDPITKIHSVFISTMDKGMYQYFDIDNKNIHKRTCEVLSNVDLVSIAIKRLKNRESINKKVLRLKKMIPSSIYQFIKEKKDFLKTKNVRKQTKNFNEKAFLIDGFIGQVETFLKYDNELFFGCDAKKYAIKMEELVSDPEYYKKVLLNKINPNLEVDDTYLKRVFSENRFWVHRDKPLKSKDIWEAWPSSMKDLYSFYFNKFNLKKFCDFFDYKINY